MYIYTHIHDNNIGLYKTRSPSFCVIEWVPNLTRAYVFTFLKNSMLDMANLWLSAMSSPWNVAWELCSFAWFPGLLLLYGPISNCHMIIYRASFLSLSLSFGLLGVLHCFFDRPKPMLIFLSTFLVCVLTRQWRWNYTRNVIQGYYKGRRAKDKSAERKEETAKKRMCVCPCPIALWKHSEARRFAIQRILTVISHWLSGRMSRAMDLPLSESRDKG